MKILTSKLINCLQHFQTIEKEWEELRLQFINPSMCTSWLWLTTWSENYLCNQDKLFIHFFYNNKQLVGITPLYLKKITYGYELRFIATGEKEEEEVCSEFQDFIINDEYKNEIFNLLNQQIKNHKKIYSIALNNILDSSFAQQWWHNFNSLFFLKYKTNITKQFILPIKQTQEKQVLSFKSKNIRRHANKFYSANITCTTQLRDKQDFEAFYQALINLHNKAWNSKGINGCFENNKFVTFHRVFMQKLLEKNQLILFKLNNENECVAIFYGVIDGNTLHYYQSGININCKLSSVGVAMHVEAISIAREHKLKFYDLMQGSISSYKSRYVLGKEEVASSFITHPLALFFQILIRLKRKLL
ncbi:MAG: hypothetical protein COB83_05280 [Gammaproteobacteria bacterium]|nr:MAG: hypothetical protein COB83_05280 [Gammaproteobacteria bacterium]